MRGQTIIELLLAIGLAGIILPALLTGLVASRSGKAQQIQRLEAVTLLKETEEAVRSVRENDWNTFAVNGTFHPQVSGSSWVLATGSASINGFTRSVVVNDVERDSNGVIVSSGGTVDPSSKKLVITISWGTPLPSSTQSTIYLMRLDNITYVETTEADFDNGTNSGADVTNTSGGEVILGSGGGGNWCEPSETFWEYDLPKNGVANAITATEGQVYAGTGNNSSGESYILFDVTDPTAAYMVDSLDGYKTNDVFGEQDYGYIVTDKNSTELVIIRLSDMTVTATFDTPGKADGESIFVSGNIAYVTAGSKLYAIDVSDKSAPFALNPDGVTLPGTGTSVYVVGTYAYVAIGGNSSGFRIIDLSTYTIVGQGVVNDQPGRDIVINDTATRAYLVSESSGIDEVNIVDTSSKTGTRPILGSYDTGAMDPYGIAVVPGNRAIVVGSGSEEYQVLNIEDEANPVRCGGLDINSGINGVASVLESDGDAFSYIITGDSSSELKIIRGGSGGGQYTASGTFESQTIPIPMPVNETSFNRFEVNLSRLPQTDIQFHVSAEQAILSSCSGVTFNFVGPDGTSSTFFTTSVTTGPQAFDYSIPVSINPGQCFRYKIFLSTLDSSQTPVFYDITINYAP